MQHVEVASGKRKKKVMGTTNQKETKSRMRKKPHRD
jgi:hypothetical protein